MIFSPVLGQLDRVLLAGFPGVDRVLAQEIIAIKHAGVGIIELDQRLSGEGARREPVKVLGLVIVDIAAPHLGAGDPDVGFIGPGRVFRLDADQLDQVQIMRAAMMGGGGRGWRQGGQGQHGEADGEQRGQQAA